MDRLVAEPVLELRAHLEDCAGRVIFGVGFDGAIYAAAARSAEPSRDRRGRWKTVRDEPTDYVVLRASRGAVDTIVVREESLHVDHVQPCPEGLLLVGSRCAWRPARAGPTKNAMKVDANGVVLSRFTLGDGIHHVRVAYSAAVHVRSRAAQTRHRGLRRPWARPT